MSKGPTQAEFYAAQLAEIRKKWDAGHIPALHHAVDLCELWKIALPAWANDALRNQLREKYIAPGKENRKNNPRWRYQRDFIAWARWREVEKARALAALARGDIEAVARKPDLLDAEKAGRPKKGDIAPKAWLKEATEKATAELGKTIAAGTPRQMGDDYMTVQKAGAAGDAVRFDFDMSILVPERNSRE